MIHSSLVDSFISFLWFKKSPRPLNPRALATIILTDPIFNICLNFNLLLFVISFRYDFFKSIRSSIHRSLKRRKLFDRRGSNLCSRLRKADYPAYNLHPFFLSDRDKLFSDKRSG